MILKFKKQKIEVIKSTHPDLYESIQLALKNLSDDDKGIVAGLIIEAVIDSGGSVEIFTDEIVNDIDVWDENFETTF